MHMGVLLLVLAKFRGHLADLGQPPPDVAAPRQDDLRTLPMSQGCTEIANYQVVAVSREHAAAASSPYASLRG